MDGRHRPDAADQCFVDRRWFCGSRPDRRGATLALLVFLALLWGSFAQAQDASVPTDGADLGSRLASGEVVVLGTARISGMKLRIDVERVLRGEDLPETFRLAISGANLQRLPNTPSFGMEDGERAVLVVQHRLDRRGQKWGDHVYIPAIGYRSKITIPAEGAQALLEATEGLVDYQDAMDRGRVEAGLVDWLTGPNPWLVDFALQQAAEYELAEEPWITGLLDLTRSVSPWHRRQALRALGGALARGRLVPRKTASRVPRYDATGEELVRRCQETIVSLARTDEDVEVRREGVEQLARSGYSESKRVLQTMADKDPSQEVRYDAAAALRKLDQGSRP